MKYLLDTHVFLWFITDSQELGEDTKTLLESDVYLYISIASLWEIAIKNSLGRLNLPSNYYNFIEEQLEINDIEVLSIYLSHLNAIIKLPFHHREPFDRLLIAQILTEQMPIISKDKIFDNYLIQRIWS